jgi:predicted  nucleic acid-binding Zn-ribbon protein
MDADLERLIALQKLDSAAHDAEQRLAGEPERLKALETRLETARGLVAAAKDRLKANQEARRTIEKDVAVHQGRLSKFREQGMAVKTNQEFHAIQHEIAFAQTEIKNLEDKILELMVEGDEVTSAIKSAEAALAAEEKAGLTEKKLLEAEQADMQVMIERLKGERAAMVSAIAPTTLSTFETVARRRNGVAVAEARDGICTICHVRLRPQVFNTVLRNDQIVQCDSCLRILYAVPRQPAAVAEQPPSAS